MQNEQTPAAGPLTAESVALLKKGDWLLRDDGRAGRFISPDAYLSGWLNTFELIDTACERFTFLGRPDQDGWIAWHGGENPVPGIAVDVLFECGEDVPGDDSDGWEWDETGSHAIVKWRPHVPSPASSSSVVQGDASGEREALIEAISNADQEYRRLYGEPCCGEERIWWLESIAGGALAALRPQPSGETREAVARLAWTYACSSYELDPGYDIGWSRALDLYANEPRYTESAKAFVDRTWAFADAILTAISTPAQASETGGEMIGHITQALVRADEEFGNSLSAYRYRKLAEAVAALSAHPPAQTSESGVDRWLWLKARVDTLVNILAPDQGEMLTEDGRRLFAIASAIQSDLAALSAPQAAPGEGEQS